MNPIERLETCGQSAWLDFLQRSLLARGDLRRLIERDHLKGLTSNPSIFEKAIGESEDYSADIEQFLRGGDHDVSAIYEHLAIADIRAAADEFLLVFEATQGRDGYVSLECAPRLAHDAEGTVREALRLWKAVARPNLMIKVPATHAGVSAIGQLIGQGVNVNVTLLFSVAVYEEVVEAYISGLDRLRRAGGDVSRIASVASFFISRIDTAADQKLESIPDRQAAEKLRGQVAIANAKIAYSRYKDLFSSERWRALEAMGAKTQRLLWASTSAKNPAFRDTMYVEALIGRDTVDTMPPETMDAFREHGEVDADSVEKDVAGARAVLAELKRLGISLDAVTDELVADGVKKFADAFDKLFEVLKRRRQTLIEGGRVALHH